VVMIRFICFKWGKKYSHKYVNYLNNMVKKYCQLDFDFNCITDNPAGLSIDIKTYDIKEMSHWRGTSSSMFTIEKVSCFKNGFLNCNGPYVLLDLDILIHNDITEYLNSYNFYEPRIIKNYWNYENHKKTAYGDSWCDINSSFVTWKDNQLDGVFNFYQKNIDKISKVYDSFDKSLYYLQENEYSFHPRKLVYSYNSGAEYPNDLKVATFRPDYKICIFNNSHGIGLDISDTKHWARDLWESNREL